MKKLDITSPSFQEGKLIPKKHTGFGEDKSPSLHIKGLSPLAKSLAVILYDLDIPFVDEYCHWCIWNLPVTEVIPEGIPHGGKIPDFGNAIQGMAYGKHCYRGPKPPIFIRTTHHYSFRVYSLDCLLTLTESAGNSELLNAMEGHILQTGELMGTYKR